MPTKPEVLKEIKRRNAEMKAKIASGEIQLCSKQRPMPEKRASIGWKWYHEDATTDRESTAVLTQDNSEEKKRIFLCPNCGIRFPVTLKRIVPRAV